LNKVEFRTNENGHAYISIENDPTEYICGNYEIYEIFSSVGNRIEIQLAEGCTIFLMGSKQIEKIKSLLPKQTHKKITYDYTNS